MNSHYINDGTAVASSRRKELVRAFGAYIDIYIKMLIARVCPRNAPRTQCPGLECNAPLHIIILYYNIVLLSRTKYNIIVIKP